MSWKRHAKAWGIAAALAGGFALLTLPVWGPQYMRLMAGVIVAAMLVGIGYGATQE
jgi:hypothetical protein